MDNCTFWRDLLKTEEFTNKADYKNFYTLNRISVLVKGGDLDTYKRYVCKIGEGWSGGMGS
ncbi:hypothetical protein [Maribacter antarcticus]|uniref:hypothetical protein n=1 Tax=Maribacter antarcticus TaxID=505250 RepID=UPI000AE1AF7F|nr:hypothetical protein [Maribacter antarcticus]